MKIKSFKPKLTKLLPQKEGVSEMENTQEVVQQNLEKTPDKITDYLKIIPLGGVGEVTKNMYIYEYKDDILIVDCGMGFPDEGMLGVDLVIPDISYLKDKKSKIRAIIITHGHEDHIGGLPYIWDELQVPIFAPPLAAGFIRSKFDEAKLPKDVVNVTDINSALNFGVFTIQFYRVSHSVPDSTGLIIDTPVGRIIHQSDFKIDWSPVNNQVTDVAKLSAAARDKEVLLMLIDGLGSEKKGVNPSERPIQDSFFHIAEKTVGKVIITTNSSNITRMQQAINVAVQTGRRLALVGRSMENNFQVARDLGYLEVPPGLVIATDEIKKFADDRLMILIAGSQGQPSSSLSRAANNSHRFVSLKKTDSVIFSADPIPLSMNTYYALIDKLSRMGIDVYYSANSELLHVSGHACSDEIKLMVALAQPKYIMPIGTTFRGQRAFLKLMNGLGYKDSQVMTLSDIHALRVIPGKVEIGEKIEAKNVYVDGLGVGDVGNVILRDRQVMAEEGIVIVMLPIDHQTGKLAGEPDIISRGFVFEKTSEELLNAAKGVVESSLSDFSDGELDWRFSRSQIEENLEKFFYEETKRRPLILPVVVEV